MSAIACTATEGGSPSSPAPQLPVGRLGAWRWRHAIIAPALVHQFGSKGRGDAVRAICANPHRDGAGRLRTYSDATIRAWIARYEAGGFGALNRKARSDRRKARTLISRAWDRATAEAGMDRSVQEDITAEVRQFIRNLWANRTKFGGWQRISDHATDRLEMLTADKLGGSAPAASHHVCQVPRKMVEREKRFARVATFDYDRKAHEDHQRPRIQRDNTTLKPLQSVLGDVHPIDIYYRRDDGSEATAKLIGWKDEATHRLFAKVVFLEKGQGVRQEHVIRAFIDMATDPLWGMPSGLYLDNGREYDWTDFVDDAMQLAGFGVHYKRPSAVTKAKPYNAAAKGLLEGAFRNLERRFLSPIPGWIDGDRMRKKVQNVGRPPAVFPGSRDDLERAVQDVIRVYNDTPQRRSRRIRGKSPNEAYSEHVKAGWGSTEIAEIDLHVAFCRRVHRTVTKGRVEVEGAFYYCDEFQWVSAGTKVDVGIPKSSDFGRILVWLLDGRFLGAIEPDRLFASGDPTGARESTRREKVAKDAVEALRKEIRPLDTLALLNGQASRVKAPDPAPVIARISLGHDKEGKALLEAPSAKRSRETGEHQSYLAAFNEEFDLRDAKKKRASG